MLASPRIGDREGASSPSLRAKLPFEISITFTEKGIHEDGREACLERYHP